MKTKNPFPSVSDRAKAMVVDMAVWILLAILSSILFGYFPNAPDYARIVAFVSIFILYEPILVSVAGGTLGHYFAELRVRNEFRPERKLNFVLAFLRFLGKAALGWISLLIVTADPKRQAIHDKLVGSIVIFAKQQVFEVPKPVETEGEEVEKWGEEE